MNINYSLLQQRSHIQPVSDAQKNLRIAQELQSLARLQTQEIGYLNQYDQLFRYVSLVLLEAGYELTNHQPHQVLKMICTLYCSEREVEAMIKHRHALKKRMAFEVLPAMQDVLAQCISRITQYITSL